MAEPPDILCIGSVLWDVIGRTPIPMRLGADVPGRITRLPGGVAMNIAMTLQRFGLRVALLSAVGQDHEGVELIGDAARLGLVTDYIYRSVDLPTDRYMAVEAKNGLIAAVADAHSLETAGDRILAPLWDGRLGSAAAPWRGPVALDGNLTRDLLAEIAAGPAFALAHLHVAPASPGKAERLLALVGHPRATFYTNLEEAGLICHREFIGTADAARALVTRGVARAIVTDGARPAADADSQAIVTGVPPEVLVTRVTGAGDTFMAAHIVAERDGADRQAALDRALQAAAIYVSGEPPQ